MHLFVTRVTVNTIDHHNAEYHTYHLSDCNHLATPTIRETISQTRHHLKKCHKHAIFTPFAGEITICRSFIEIEKHILGGKRFLCVCRPTRRKQKTVREEGFDVTKGMNRSAEVAAMRNERIGETTVTGNPT
jgi:hypothetical protein